MQGKKEMVRRKKTKTTALVLTAICIFISAVQYVALPTQLLQDVAICKDCSILARLAYSFFHASLIHALINCWCLLSIVFIYDVSISYLALAYAIAVTFPIDTIASVSGAAPLCGLEKVSGAAPLCGLEKVLGAAPLCGVDCSTPTVGLSAVCFALMGMVSFQSCRKAYFHTWVLSFLVATAALPYIGSVCGYVIATPNNWLHLYCYVAGLLVGFLNSPASEYHRACTNGQAQQRVNKVNSPDHAKG